MMCRRCVIGCGTGATKASREEKEEQEEGRDEARPVRASILAVRAL